MKSSKWVRLRRALSRYLEDDCQESRDQFERDLKPFLEQRLYPPADKHKQWWFVLEGIQVVSSLPIGGSVRSAMLVGTGPTGMFVVTYLRKRNRCWFSSWPTPVLDSPRAAYRLVSPKLAAEILAGELAR